MSKRIAIIGTGISGMTCGYLLHKQNDVVLYEASDYIGGHTATIDVSLDGRDYEVAAQILEVLEVNKVNLMTNNIPAFENLANLDKLPATGVHVVALPVKIRGGSGGPLRIVARVPTPP